MYHTEILDCLFCKAIKVGHQAYNCVHGEHKLTNDNILLNNTHNKLYELRNHRTLSLKDLNVRAIEQKFNINENKKDEIIFKICNHCKSGSLYFGNELIYPIMPQGEALPPEVPEEIRKDFDEARLIVNNSVRCAVALLRICTEHILHWLVEERMPEKTEEVKNLPNLSRKIEKVKSYKIDGINSKTFDMLDILKEYGNDNSHSIRKIDDSDTMEAFNDLSSFIISISKQIIALNAEDEKINQMKQNIAQKNQN